MKNKFEIIDILRDILDGTILQFSGNHAMISTKLYGNVFVIIDVKSFVYSDGVDDFKFEGNIDIILNQIKDRLKESEA